MAFRSDEPRGWTVVRRFGLLIAAVFVVLPSVAHAQRGMSRYRNAPAMTAYGPVYNPTQTPEWRQAGGNFEVWQQIMMQKMAVKEQAAFQKQTAAYQKAMQAQAKAAKNAPTQTTQGPRFTPQRRTAKKKKASVKSSATATTDAGKDPKAVADEDEADEANDVAKQAPTAADSAKATATKTP